MRDIQHYYKEYFSYLCLPLFLLSIPSGITVSQEVPYIQHPEDFLFLVAEGSELISIHLTY